MTSHECNPNCRQISCGINKLTAEEARIVSSWYLKHLISYRVYLELTCLPF